MTYAHILSPNIRALCEGTLEPTRSMLCYAMGYIGNCAQWDAINPDITFDVLGAREAAVDRAQAALDSGELYACLSAIRAYWSN